MPKCDVHHQLQNFWKAVKVTFVHFQLIDVDIAIHRMWAICELFICLLEASEQWLQRVTSSVYSSVVDITVCRLQFVSV